MAPLHRGSQLFSQMRWGGRISARLLFFKRTNMTSDNSHPQRLSLSDATAKVWRSKSKQGPRRKLLIYGETMNRLSAPQVITNRLFFTLQQWSFNTRPCSHPSFILDTFRPAHPDTNSIISVTR